MNPLLALDSYALGNPLGEHRPSWRAPLFIVLVLTLPSALIVWLFLSKFPYPMWTAAAMVGTLATVLVGGIFLSYIGYQRRFRIYEHGLIDIQAWKTSIYRWDEIDHIRTYDQMGQALPHTVCKIRFRNGTKLTLHTTPSLESHAPDSVAPVSSITMSDLIEGLNLMVLPLLIARSIERYQAGERLDFEKFQLSIHGIHVRGQVLSWSQVADLISDGNLLIIRAVGRDKPWRTIHIAAIPNRDVLPALITQTQNRQFSAFSGNEHTETTQDAIQALRAAHRRLTWQRRIQGWALFIAILSAQIGFKYAQYYTSVEGHVDRAQALQGNDNYQAALAELNEAVRKEPTNASVYVERCMVYRQLGHFDAAFADCRHALALRPNYLYAHVTLGRVYHRKGEYAQALAEYEPVIKQDPTYSYVYCSRAFTYKRMGRKAAAIADFNLCRRLTTQEWWKTESDREIREISTTR